MRRWSWRLLAISFLLLMGLFPCQAEEADEGTHKKAILLGKVVVTATKTEKALEDVPGSVTVIDKEQMKKKNIETVDDALNSISGLFVKRSKGLMDSTTCVRMRGFADDEYSLVLLGTTVIGNRS